MSSSEQLKLLQKTLEDLFKSDIATFGDNFTEDFHREFIPQGIMPDEKSRADLLGKMGRIRSIFTDGSKMEVREFVEQPGSIMAFIHERSITLWGETLDTDMVMLAKFTTGEDGKLKISSIKHFIEASFVTKLTESMKANGIPVPGA